MRKSCSTLKGSNWKGKTRKAHDNISDYIDRLKVHQASVKAFKEALLPEVGEAFNWNGDIYEDDYHDLWDQDDYGEPIYQRMDQETDDHPFFNTCTMCHRESDHEVCSGCVKRARDEFAEEVA